MNKKLAQRTQSIWIKWATCRGL